MEGLPPEDEKANETLSVIFFEHKKPSNKEMVSLLEGLLEKAKTGDLDYVCVVSQTGKDIKASWQGIDNAQKTLDALKGLAALSQAIQQAKGL